MAQLVHDDNGLTLAGRKPAAHGHGRQWIQKGESVRDDQ